MRGVKIMSSERKLTILIVDDSATQREHLSKWLKEKGYDIFTAQNGTDGLAKAFDILPDFVISDIVMPDMNGYLMCRLLKNEEITSGIPVILLTDLAEEKHRFWGLKCGADAYVVKGEESEKLLSLINAFSVTPSASTTNKKDRLKKKEGIKPQYHVSKVLDKLLLESTVYLEIINLFNLVDDSTQLINQFFDFFSQMVVYSQAGLLIMDSGKPVLYIHCQEKLTETTFRKIKTMVVTENKLTEEDVKCGVIKQYFRQDATETKEINSSLSSPLKKGLGCISVFSSKQDAYDESTESVVHLLADSFSMVVEPMLSYQKVKLQTITDILTGLYNRNYLELNLDREINSYRGYKNKFCVIMISIDFYKTLVDTFGRRRGEMILRQAAEFLKKHFRATDLIAQYGRSEFVGVFVQTDLAGAHIGAERLRKKIEEHFTQSAQRPFRLTVSIGVAEFTDQLKSKDELIDNAMVASKRARNKGGNRVEDFIIPLQ